MEWNSRKKTRKGKKTFFGDVEPSTKKDRDLLAHVSHPKSNDSHNDDANAKLF